MDRVRKRASDVLNIAVWIVDRREGRQRTVSLLSAWEGLGRFTRQCCDVEPEPLAAAEGVAAATGRPGAGGAEAVPKAQVDETLAGDWHASLAGAWRKHAAAEPSPI